MSQINDILDIIKSRCESIAGVSAANVVKRKRKFGENELPGIAVYRGRAPVRYESGGEYSLETSLQPEFYVEYYKGAGDDPAADADAMEIAIVQAVEQAADLESDLPYDLIRYVDADEPALPDDDGTVVAVRVQFTTTVYRGYGAAENQ